MEPDFGGYATKAGLKCSDGVTIMPNAFKHNDNKTVPLVWQHDINSSENILGHAVLEHREDGVYAYGYFNDTPSGQNARELVKHRDINMLSIRANELRKQGQNVVHGEIREVSLVLAGANPGAFIDNVTIQHGDGYAELDDEATIYTGLEIEHQDNKGDDDVAKKTTDNLGDKTVKDVYESFTEEQKQVVHYLVSEALEEGSDDEDDEETKHEDKSGKDEELQHDKKGDEMTANVFEQNGASGGAKPTLTHTQLETIMADAKSLGSFKESFLKHAQEYGITNIDVLFPDAKTLENSPELITRKVEWVETVMNGIKKNPFSRIKSISADVRHEEARALGYIKGNLKKEEFFALQSRVTTPTTIYKKQKLDRDDVHDITDLDVVAWLKAEMKLMVREEIARAVLIGDGRPAMVEDDGEMVPNPDKIKAPSGDTGEGQGIRPIAHDHEFYSHKVVIPANVKGDALVDAIIRNRKYYRGSGNPTMFTTEDILNDLLLSKDKIGRKLYANISELQSTLRVSNIVTVEVMESESVEGGELLAIMVNLGDYTLGADRGGALSMFDDFDIDYNQYKYLMETRISGALTKFKTALVFSRATGTKVTPSAPTFNSETNTITIPSVTGVTYSIDDSPVTGTVVITENTTVEASANEDYYFADGTTTEWTFEFNDQAQ